MMARAVHAVLFDMGGTLDGDGLHWLDRFAALYADEGVSVGRDEMRAAFDDAERRAAVDEAIATAHLDEMIDQHVAWQLSHLGLAASELRRQLADKFAASMRAAAIENARVLADLSARGLKLGVVSNGCGNVDVLCRDLGYASYLSVIVDSRRVGLFKPDPAIFIYAAAKLALPPSSVLMVGDSFDRDVRPARSAGLSTAWLEGRTPRECPDPALVDVRLRRLSELPLAIDSAAVGAGARRS
jgi:putative hydrolase of the HAD superfamily